MIGEATDSNNRVDEGKNIDDKRSFDKDKAVPKRVKSHALMDRC